MPAVSRPFPSKKNHLGRHEDRVKIMSNAHIHVPCLPPSQFINNDGEHGVLVFNGTPPGSYEQEKKTIV